MNEDKPVNSSNNFKLKYITLKSQTNQVSKVTDLPSNMRQQYVLTVGPTLNQPHGEDMINIQLNYDSNQALDPES